MSKNALKKIVGLSCMFLVLNPANLYAATLKMGSNGSEVSQLQKNLKSLNYFTYKTTSGFYGLATKTAVSKFQKDHGIKTDGIAGDQTLALLNEIVKQKSRPKESIKVSERYTVQKGDTLFKLAKKFNVPAQEIKNLNQLANDLIYPNQKLVLPYSKTGVNSSRSDQNRRDEESLTNTYTVQSGDTLWLLAQRYNTSVENIISLNNLNSSDLELGQKLLIKASYLPNQSKEGSNISQNPVYNWPSITYIVQAGDTIDSIARKFGTTPDEILKYNYMTEKDYFNANDKVAINGFAPRINAVTPGEDSQAKTVGKLVDWFLDGKYLLKRGDIFTIADIESGSQFKVQMYGGVNHCDVEPLTAADTQTMKSLFGSWAWTPRAVVIFKDGMNIAASLSGMPHTTMEKILDNNVTGHFDLYLYNSKPHDPGTSKSYVEQHYQMVLKAANE